MRRILLVFLLIAASAPLHAQALTPPDIKGHFIGEPIADFMSIEPDAQQEADVCRDRAMGASCSRLLAALDHNGRAEVTTSNGADYMLDGGRLVKATMLVQGNVDQTVASLTLKFGPANDKAIPNQNSSGVKWENHLLSWNNGTLYATLYQDNNPVLQSRLPVLVMETSAEHVLEQQSSKDRVLNATQTNK